MKIPLDTTFDHQDPYKVLGVTADAAPVAIQKAYLNLARRSHPDLFATDPEKYRSATALMQDINAAYGLLSDPAQREFWDRRHQVAPRAATRTRPRAAPRPAPKQSVHYNPERVHLVIRTYNEFLDSLRTATERRDAVRRIRKFQASRSGADFTRRLVASHYGKVMDLLMLGRRISVYDDGLVEMMFLYDGALEVAPSNVFITYAYVVHRRNHGKLPPDPGDGKRRVQSSGSGVIWLQSPGPPRKPGSTGRESPRDITVRVWDWLMARPGSDSR